MEFSCQIHQLCTKTTHEVHIEIEERETHSEDLEKDRQMCTGEELVPQHHEQRDESQKAHPSRHLALVL